MSHNGGSGFFYRGLAVVLFLLYSAIGFSAPQASGMEHDHGAMDMDMDHDHGAMDMDHHHGAMTPSPPVVWSLLLATLAIAGGLILSARRVLRRPVTAGPTAGANVLDLPVIGRALRSRRFLAFLIVPTMAIFLLIVLAGLRGEQDTDNPAILLTWILWWPAVIFTFFLAGRVWCSFCPFGYLGQTAQKIFSFRLRVPGILKNMWWRLGLFLALTWVTTLWALDRWPLGTAWLGLGLTLGAITLAVVFEKRTFCRYVCPVGGVFGLYSMTAPLRLAVKDPEVCRSACSGKDCFESCAWFQFPPAMDRGAECSLCLDCVRACPEDNIALRTQAPGADLASFQTHRKSIDEASAIAAVMGVALLQTAVMLSGWSGWEAKVGNWLHLAPGATLYTISYVAVGAILPLLLLGLVCYASQAQEEAGGGLGRALRTYAYCFLPLGLALHAAHNFHHLFGEGGAIWPGLKKALAEYAGRTVVALPPAAAAPNLLFVLQWATLMAGLYLTYRVGVARVRRNGPRPERAFRAVLPILLFAAAYTAMNVFMLSAPMAHRH
jgi:polyferredoxin